MTRISIGVLFGGRSGEHEVSLMSARSVLAVLNREKYDIYPIAISHEGVWLSGENALAALESGQTDRLTPVTLLPYPGEKRLFALRGQTLQPIARLDVIFPILHGSYGEDGTLQGLLEMADLAYVGAGVLGSAVGMDKALFKDVMRTHAVPVLESLTVSRYAVEHELPAVLEQAEAVAPYPLFVKPANLGSSVGVNKCHDRPELIAGLLDAARYDRRILIERGIDAREIEVSVLGNEDLQASVPGEIHPCDEFYTYSAKYLDDRSELVIPAPLSAPQIAQIQEVAIRACRAADCTGMARADFLLDKHSGEIYLNEINSIPGFTRISMYPKLWEASGLPYPALVDRLIELALESKAERDQTERRYRREA